ncbi:NADH dehydrogenase [ubiquinone] 1 alpha subcomplex subunit 7 [Blomia tropicalis]|nr:NADH dehydrogenase [ubiquinone] 1 alpha subcomplex subunit 7 [Blomia tropicalis]
MEFGCTIVFLVVQILLRTMSYRRDISASLQLVRTLLLGRTWNGQNRFQEDLSSRPYPKPDLTGGPSHKASENYYFSRDARRAVLPMEDLKFDQKQIEATPGIPVPVKKASAPGHVYHWD